MLVRLPILGVALVVAAAPLRAETLVDALARAYTTSPEIQAARRELGAVNEQVPQALSGWRPEVSVSGSAGHQRFDQSDSFQRSTGGGGTAGSDSDESLNPWQAQLEVRQPLYRGGRTEADTERAVNTVGAQRQRLAATEQDVLFRAAQAYMDVWRDQSVLELNENNVEVLRRQLEATQDRFDVGEVTRTDVAQAEARLAQAIADRIAAQGELESSRATYKQVIGSPPGELEQPSVPEILPANREATVSRALDGNPDVVAARFTEQAARREVRRVVGELLPQADLIGRLSRSENTISDDSSSSSAEVLAQVTVPLYQQGAVSSRVRAAKQTANQRRLEVRTAERTVEELAVSAWEDLQTARASIESFQEEVRAAEIALEGVRQENLVGARTTLDVLDAEQELLNAQVDLVRAQRNEIVASYAVLQAVGRLRAAPLELPVTIYDVESAYQAVRGKIWGWDLPDEAGRSENTGANE